MTRVRTLPLLALGTLSVSLACGEPPLAPSTDNASASLSVIEGPSAAPARYLVVAKASSGIPDGLGAAVSAAGGVVDVAYDDVGVTVVSGLDESGASSLRKLGGVAFVEAEPVIELEEPVELGDPVGPDESGAFEGEVADASDPTAAFFFTRQWNMHAIDAPGAWAAGRLGSPGTTIAILDTGIDYLHADLAGRVDLSRSASFVPFDDFVVSILFPTRHPITDLHFHGTHVASTAVSNGLGVAGVTSGATLIGVKVCSAFEGCPGSAIFAGVMHAVQQGADVANMSLGGSFSKSDFPGFVSAIQRLFNWANRQGTVFVVSAGNDALDLDHDGNGFKTYCNAANVVCVSATGPTSGSTFGGGPYGAPDTPAPYTNFGRSAVSVAAPGGFVASVIGACSQTTLISALAICGTAPTWYVGSSGTSMAAPHATGVAALISEDVGRRPGLIRQRLMQSADDLGQRGTDPYFGRGRINAAAGSGAD